MKKIIFTISTCMLIISVLFLYSCIDNKQKNLENNSETENSEIFNNSFVAYSEKKLSDSDKSLIKNYISSLNIDASNGMVLSYISSYQYHIDTVNVTYHDVLNSNRYALALLNLDEKQYESMAEQSINSVLSLQDTISTSKSCGVWPYYKEEPLATKKSPVDYNWADFNGVVLLDIYMHHGKKLNENLLARIKKSLILAAQSIQKRDVELSYTNIAIMGTYVTYMVSHLFDLPEMKNYSVDRLNRFYNFTKDKNGFTEYNTPHYTFTALNEITRLKQHIVEPNALSKIEELNDICWNIVATHYHIPTKQWAGPHSRSYDTFLDQEEFNGILLKASKGVVALGKTRYVVHDLLLEYDMPEKYNSYFFECNYPKIIDEVYDNDYPEVKGYTYMTDNYAFSTVNRACLWNQRRPFTVFWGNGESPKAFQVKFLHDDYDYSSSAIYTSQKENKSVSIINLYLGGGDKHIGIDKIKDGLLKVSDLRIRFLISGGVDIDGLKLPTEENNSFQIQDNGLSFNVKLCYSDFNGSKGKWEKGSKGDISYIDYIIYKGPEKIIDLKSLHTAAWAFAFSLTDEGDIITFDDTKLSVLNNDICLKWGDISITATDKLENLGTYPDGL